MSYTIQFIISILIQVESGGDDSAIGDNGRAVGCLQIHPIMVDEVNRIQRLRHKKKQVYVFTLEDRLSRHKSIRMATIFLSHNRPKCKDDIQLAVSWNTGSIRKDSPSYRKKVVELISKSKGNKYGF